MSHVQLRRGDGTTTLQMTDAAEGALFIWCNGHLDYPRQLARKLGRTDLKIYSPSALENHFLAGLRFPAIVLDHACDLTADQIYGFNRLLTFVR